MDILSIIILGIGLAMDCFAVSVSKGVCAKKLHFFSTLKMALLFGFFQGIMPLIGFFAGISFAHQIEAFDHWVAFVLLFIIGGKMIYEGLQPHDPDCSTDKNPFKWSTLISLAIATSIDALATGIIFINYPHLIWISIAIIGIISFLFSFLGMYIGVRFGNKFHVKVEVIGGIILIGIGLKILIEHIYLA